MSTSAQTTLMGILILLIIFALGVWAWTFVVLFRRIRQQHAGRGIWFVFFSLIFIGIAVGFWCAFYCEYPVGSRFRIGGFPIPIVFFHFEDGRWVDFPVPALQAWLTMITNVIIITGLFTLPVWLISRACSKK